MRRTAAVVISVVAISAVSAPRSVELPTRMARGGQCAGIAEVGLPLVFEENRGQTDDCVRFLARTQRGTFFVTPDETVLRLRAGAVRSRFVGSNPSPRVEGEEPLSGRAHYFLGRDPAKWRTDVPMFARVRCRDLYPGVDVVWYGREGRLEYDLVVAPGADPASIELAFDGADRRELDGHGDLVLHCGQATVVQRRPVVYQETAEGRRVIPSRYVLVDDRVRFELDGRDPARPVFIDPQVIYGTFLGGNGQDVGRNLFRDSAGNTYVCGNTTSSDFPRSDAIPSTYAGAGQFGDGDGFVTKIDPTGTSIVFSTYLGGGDDDRIARVRLDPSNNVCVAGQSYSSDFPTTAGVVQSTNGGRSDCVVAKLNPSGSALVFSTYLGGGSDDSAEGMAVSGSGDVYITGQAATGFPTTLGAFQTTPMGGYDAYVAKIDPSGTTLLYSTLLGGSGIERTIDLAVDSLGDAFVTGYVDSADFPTLAPYQASFGGGGYDGFVTGVDAAGATLLFSTYLGGSGYDLGLSVAIGAGNHVLVTGLVGSTDLATVAPLQAANAGGQDVLFAEFTSAGVAVHVGYLGGSGDDYAETVVIDAQDKVWLGGCTSSTDFPVVGAPQTANAGGTDAFFARLDASNAAVEYATYLGGASDDCIYAMTVDPDGTPYAVGTTSSDDFPRTAGALQTTKSTGVDAFLSTPPAPPVPPPPPAIDSYFLPKRVKAKPNPKDATKSTLVVSGFFDTGSGSPDLAAAATLTIGTTDFPIQGLTPSADGRKFNYSAGGIAFLIVKNAFGSSRAKFRLKRTGDLAGLVPQSGELALRFRNAVVDGRADVTLTAGKFVLGRIRGALIAPNLFVVRAAARLEGAGKDALTLVVGLATNGVTPAAASDLHVKFGALDAVIPASAFTKVGDRFLFKGNVGGVTRATLDYLRETITIKAANATLGSFVEGGNATTIVVGLGGDERSVVFRTSRKGGLLRY